MYECPECAGRFDDPEETTTSKMVFPYGIIRATADCCPWCGERMDGTLRDPRNATEAGS